MTIFVIFLMHTALLDHGHYGEALYINITLICQQVNNEFSSKKSE